MAVRGRWAGRCHGCSGAKHNHGVWVGEGGGGYGGEMVQRVYCCAVERLALARLRSKLANRTPLMLFVVVVVVVAAVHR